MLTNKYVILGFQEKDETDKLSANLNDIFNETVQTCTHAIKGAQFRLESETLTKIGLTKSTDELRYLMTQARSRFDDLLIGTELILEKRQSVFQPFVEELQAQGCPHRSAENLAYFVLDRILQTHDWVVGNGNCWAKLEGTKILCAPPSDVLGDDSTGSAYLVEVEFTSLGWVLNSVTPNDAPPSRGLLGFEFTLSPTCCSDREIICPGF